MKGLNFDATEDDVKNFFNTFTKVKSLNLLLQNNKSKNKGIAFIKL